MATRVGALAVSTARAEDVVRFYRTLGLPLAAEDHGDGVEHWACELSDIRYGQAVVLDGGCAGSVSRTGQRSSRHWRVSFDMDFGYQGATTSAQGASA
jgi:hypothetical protein